jgi:hypothetical protein
VTNGAGEPGPSALERDWVLALALATIVATLGVLPHLWFGMAAGELGWFKSAYDEDTYARLLLSGQIRVDRGVSFVALNALYILSGGRLDAAMILADAIFPFLAALAAFTLATRLVEGARARVFVVLLLLFGQESLSFGCGAVTSADAPWSLAALRAAAAERYPGLIPDYYTSYFSLFRTPEPQVTLVLLFLHLTSLVDLLRRAGGQGAGRALAYLAVSHAVLPWSYAFVAAPLVALEAGLALLLLVGPRRREGLRLAAAILPYAAVWGLRALAAAWTPGTFPSATRHVFRSSAPILTPSIAYGCLLLVGYAATTLFARRASRSLSGAALLAPVCFALPALLLNQQMASGFMLSTRDFERYGVYPFLVVGGAVLSTRLAGPAAGRWARPLIPLLTLVVLAVVVLGQFRVIGAFREANEASLSMARAARAAGDGPPSRILIEEAAMAPLLATRLFNFRGADGSRPVTFVVDYTDISRLMLPRFGSSVPLERASAEFHEGRVFERFARLGFSPAAVRAVLEKEGAEIETGRTFFLHFLFPLSEVWYPLTDGRMTRKQAVLEALDGVVDRYVASLGAPPERWREPVLFITPHEPGVAPTGDRWRLEHLGTGSLESSRGGFVFHAYRQSWRGEGS